MTDTASKTFFDVYGLPRPGTVTVVTGDRGVGKSTFVYQWTANLHTLYATGEMLAASAREYLHCFGRSETIRFVGDGRGCDINYIISIAKEEPPDVLVVDAVQYCYDDVVKGDIGSQTQVRAVMDLLTAFAKESGVAVVAIGHTTKSGEIAVSSAFESEIISSHIMIRRCGDSGSGNRAIFVEQRIEGKFGEKDGFSF